MLHFIFLRQSLLTSLGVLSLPDTPPSCFIQLAQCCKNTSSYKAKGTHRKMHHFHLHQSMFNPKLPPIHWRLPFHSPSGQVSCADDDIYIYIARTKLLVTVFPVYIHYGFRNSCTKVIKTILLVHDPYL